MKLIKVIEETHLTSATGLPEVDKRRARLHYNNLRQYEKETLPEFKERFDFALKTLETTGETLPSQEAQAADFIGKLDTRRYQQLSLDLENAQVLAIASGSTASSYPKTLTAAYNLACNYKVIRRTGDRSHVSAAQVPAFATRQPRNRGGPQQPPRSRGDGAQHGGKAMDTVPDNESKTSGGTDPRAEDDPDDTSSRPPKNKKSHIKCYNCGKLGHYKNQCKEEKRVKQETPAFFCGIPVHDPVQAFAGISDHANFTSLGAQQIGIDTFGGAHCFGNRALLTDIHDVEPLDLTGVGGAIRATAQGRFEPAGIDVYYSPDMPVNMLSWALISDDFPISWDQKDQAISVDFGHATLTFSRNRDNVYVHDLNNPSMTLPSFPVTVEDTRQLFTRAEVAAADKARELTHHLGGPSDKDLAKMCRMGVIKNNPVSPQDVWRATKIYGRDLASVRGKTTRN